MSGIDFLNPWFLLLGLLGIPVVAAFLNKRRVVERTVPSLVLLRQLQAEEVTRRRFAIPNNLLALLLYLLALAGVVFASADPVIPENEPRTLILVMDTSASMGAIEDGATGTRFVRGVKEVREKILPALQGRDRVGLIAAGATHEVVLEPTRDRERLDAALENLTVGGLTQTLPDALSLGEAICRHEKRGELILVSDMAVAEALAMPEKCEISVIQVGQEAGNLAISELAVREADTLGLLEVYVEILNTGQQDAQVSVDIALDGVLAEVLPLTVPAGGQTGRVITFEAPDGDHVTAKLRADRGNALTADDTAHAARHRAPKARALLVAEKPGSFTGVALSLHRRVELQTIKPADRVPAGRWDLIIFEDAPEKALLESIPKDARVVVLGADPSSFGMKRAEKQERPVISWWDFQDPLFQFVDLDTVEVHAATPIVIEDGVDALMRAGAEHALMARTEWEGRQVLALGFKPSESDFVLRIAFANFVANLIAWSGALERTAPPLRVRVGEVVPELPDEASIISLTQPMGGEIDPAAPMHRPGIYEVRAGNERVRLVSVNLLSATESNLRPRELPEGARAFEREPVKNASQGDWFWRIPLLVAIALLTLEAIVPGVLRRGRRKKARASRRRSS